MNLLYLLLFFFAIDVYAYRILFRWKKFKRPHKVVVRAYWGLAIAIYLLITALNLYGLSSTDAVWRNFVVGIAGLAFITKFIMLPFLLVDDVLSFFHWSWRSIFKKPVKTRIVTDAQKGITRSEFISRMAVFTATIPFISMGYGMLSGAYNYQIKNIRLRFPKLPAAFDGVKIVQLSDIHVGSFGDKDAVKRGIDLVLEQKPDYIFFTGDLVNNTTAELFPWMKQLSRLQAPGGTYSILGNHDYGDYHSWPDATSKQQNLRQMHQAHAAMGWRLLRNEGTLLERNGETIGLIGVENWGAQGRFSQYGKLNDAMTAIPPQNFNILLSHDPTHFDHEVKEKQPQIDLTLSGHTHGMQFGVEIPGYIKWSPASWIYPHWAGLYQFGKQHLYVNRGFGFIGYPGRVGILPEITVITLEKG